jgi:hypothetical protein
MSAIKNIKKELVKKLSAVSSVNKVYDFEKMPPDGFPAAFITFQGSDNEFFTNAENKRVHTYRVLVLAQIGQDRTAVDQVDQAEQTIQDVVGDILDAFDSDITLGDYIQVVYLEAAVGESGYVEYEGGWARSAEIMLKVHSIYLV